MVNSIKDQLKELHKSSVENPVQKTVIRRSKEAKKINDVIKVDNYLQDLAQTLPDKIRLSKALTLAGLGSRRHCDKLIEQSLVKVNGHVAELGMKVDDGDKILLCDRPVYFKIAKFQPRIIIYNKPEKEIVSREKVDDKLTVFEKIPTIRKNTSFVSIGRLDFNTSGLLIFTNCGDLANRMMHPKFAITREYMVRIYGNRLSMDQMKQMKTGIKLDDGVGVFSSIELLNKEDGVNHWYKVSVLEGRNRFVRRMFEYFELKVSRLMRTRFGEISLPEKLKMGMYYELPLLQVQTLLNKLEINKVDLKGENI